MRLTPTERFGKDLAAMNEAQRERVQRALQIFQENPRHPGLHFEKLRGHRSLHTIRVSRSARILLRATADPEHFELMRVGPHDLYDRLR